MDSQRWVRNRRHLSGQSRDSANLSVRIAALVRRGTLLASRYLCALAKVDTADKLAEDDDFASLDDMFCPASLAREVQQRGFDAHLSRETSRGENQKERVQVGYSHRDPALCEGEGYPVQVGLSPPPIWVRRQRLHWESAVAYIKEVYRLPSRIASAFLHASRVESGRGF